MLEQLHGQKCNIGATGVQYLFTVQTKQLVLSVRKDWQFQSRAGMADSAAGMLHPMPLTMTTTV